MDENTLPLNKRQWLKSMPVRISLLYFLFGTLYIFFSDRLLAVFIPSMDIYQQAQTYKGWGYVFVTTILLYFALAFEHRKLFLVTEHLAKERQRLETTLIQLEETYLEVQELARRCSKIEEVERRRLADELHDRVGQTLTAMNLNLKILQSLLPKETPQSILERLHDAQSLIAEAVNQTRDVIAELHPPILEDFGLGEALKWLGERMKKRSGVSLNIYCAEVAERLPDIIEIAFYRVAQSALDNALRHAQASQITLLFQERSQGVELIVEDDGVGFDPAIVLKSKDYPTWGVKIMRERMLAVGGQLLIESEWGKETRVVATWAKENLG